MIDSTGEGRMNPRQRWQPMLLLPALMALELLASRKAA